MMRRHRLLYVVTLSCLLQGGIVLSLSIGFFGVGWVKTAGIAMSLVCLGGLGLLLHRVSSHRL